MKKINPFIEVTLREIYDELQIIKSVVQTSKNNERHIKILYKMLTVGGSVMGFIILILLNHLAKP